MTKYSWVSGDDGYLIKKGNKTVPPTRICQLLNTKWGRYARQIGAKKNTIILVKQPKDQNDEEFTEALQGLADEILARLGITCFLVGVRELSDFHFISEEEMEKKGWVRSDRVLAYMEESFTDINKRFEEEE